MPLSSPIFDFHVTVFPDPLALRLESISTEVNHARLQLRQHLRSWMRPLSSTIHEAHSLLRILPLPVRSGIDRLGQLVPIPGLLLESTIDDLKVAMKEHHVHQALITAHPPLSSNEFVLKIAQGDPSLAVGVCILSNVTDPATRLRDYVAQGAKLLKIHTTLDSSPLDSSHYKNLLQTAADLQLPVLLHTGDRAHAQQFRPWFKLYPKIPFILAHMNYHEPLIAMDLAEEFPSLYLETSWQPAEIIGEAVRRVGPTRVLYGSNWPFVGNNFSVAMKRVKTCITAGTLQAQQAGLILGENASKLLGVSQTAG